jgi:hypothetical protein
MRALDRRTLLRGLGGAALGLPFLEAMRPRSALAQTTTTPKRIIFFQTPNGLQMDRWRGSVDPGDPTNFTLSPTLAPLAAHRDRLLILDGVSMASSYDPAQQATAHQGGAASLWTGTWAGPGQMDGGGNQLSGYAISRSLDHELALDPGVVGNTRFPAYYFGVLPSADHVISRLFYAGPSQPIGPNANPYDVHRQLFADLEANEAELTQRTQQRRFVLDAVIGDYRNLRCKLDASDRQTLERHLAHVEALERRLGELDPTVVNAACRTIDPGAPLNFYDFQILPELGRLQMDLMVMALTCDLTRIAAFQWHSPVGAIVHQWLGHTETHHDLTHQPITDQAAQEKIAQIDHWHAGQLAYLLDRLHQVVEANGRTLLENSLVVWASEIGVGWSHDRQDLPLVLAGGLAGQIRTGRHLRFNDRPAHNRLHLAILEAMGAPRAAFGAPAYCAGGPLPGVL